MTFSEYTVALGYAVIIWRGNAQPIAKIVVYTTVVHICDLIQFVDLSLHLFLHSYFDQAELVDDFGLVAMRTHWEHKRRLETASLSPDAEY